MFYCRAITAFAEFYPEPPTVILWREKESNAWTRSVLYYHSERHRCRICCMLLGKVWNRTNFWANYSWWSSKRSAAIGSLSNNDDTGTKTSVKKWIRGASNFITLIPSPLVRQMLAIFLCKRLYRSSGKEKEKESRSLLFKVVVIKKLPYSTDQEPLMYIDWKVKGGDWFWKQAKVKGENECTKWWRQRIFKEPSC